MKQKTLRTTMDSILDRDYLGAFCRHTHVEAKGAGAGPLGGVELTDSAQEHFREPPRFDAHAKKCRVALRRLRLIR